MDESHDYTAARMLSQQLKLQRVRAFRMAKTELQREVGPAITTLEVNGVRQAWRLAAVMDLVKGPLANHGLDVRFDFQPLRDGIIKGTCTLAHVDGHEEAATFEVSLSAFSDLLDAQRYYAATSTLKRITLEAVCGLATTETDDNLNQATYADTPYSEAIEPDADPKISTKEHYDKLKKIKVQWAQTQDNMEELDPEEQKANFYDWFSDLANTQLNDDNDVTVAALEAAIPSEE